MHVCACLSTSSTWCQPGNNGVLLCAACRSLRLLIRDLYYFIKHSFKWVAWCSTTAVKPPQWLMASAVGIIRGLHITNTIKSPFDTFIVVRPSCAWRVRNTRRSQRVMVPSPELTAAQGSSSRVLKAPESHKHFSSSWAPPLLSNQPLQSYLWHSHPPVPFNPCLLCLHFYLNANASPFP